MKLDARLGLFVTLVAIFMTCLVVGDIIGGKVTSFHLFGREWPFSVGQLAFPITFILTDILNEFYGRRVVRQVTFLAFAMVGLTFSIIYLAAEMPWASMTKSSDWDGVTPTPFATIFTSASRIQLSSMVAFVIGNLIDISIFFVLKKATGNRMLWLRATGSTAVSQLVDTVIISALVFAEKMTFDEWTGLVITSYVIKLGAAILITPVIYGLHELIERVFHIPPAAPEVESADIVPDR